jgi:murein endopeptidase
MKIFHILSILTLIASGCAKMTSSQTETVFKRTTVIEKPLTSTAQTTGFESQNYEPIPTEIKTKSATLKLGHTVFSDVNYMYDSKTQSILITGHVIILDNEKKMTSETDFELTGHQNNQGVVNLNQKNREDDEPVLRAKVTCLAVNKDENLTCDKAIVDFFILYKKQFYTDQFETRTASKSDLNKSQEPKSQAIEDVPVQMDVAEPAQDEEGDEESLNGRYEGQIGSTDVVEFLDIKSKSENLSLEKKQSEHHTENTDVKQTLTGNLRVTNQAVGYPDNGVLRNSTSVKKVAESLKDKKYFSVEHIDRNRFYGTVEISEMITELGKFLTTNFDDLKLYVGNISAVRGGLLKPHKSHQIGMDVDLAYPMPTTEDAEKIKFPLVVKQSTRKFFTEAYSTEKTFKLFKHAFMQKKTPVDRIFVDQLIINDLCRYAKQKNELANDDGPIVKKMFENIEHVKGHGDHFHLRLKCTANQPGCRSKIYKIVNNCPT